MATGEPFQSESGPTVQVGYVNGGKLAPAGKAAIAASMYEKGKAFVGAATLLSRQGDSEHVEYVVLHLLCQGIEIVLKGLLLFKDYDRYLRLVSSDSITISVTSALEAVSAYSMKPLRPNLDQELMCQYLYSKHLLRYGEPHDIFMTRATYSSTRDDPKAVRRIVAVIKLAERGLERKHRRHLTVERGHGDSSLISTTVLT